MTNDKQLLNMIFSVNDNSFLKVCNDLFQYQLLHNPVYFDWFRLVKPEPLFIDLPKSSEELLGQVSFLPISFFKSHEVKTTKFKPVRTFESSGTTKQNTSKHHVKFLRVYEESFLKAFQLFYGDIKDYCVLALLPSYLERQNSSLVTMADKLIKLSGHPNSGFYLDDLETLHSTLLTLEANKQKTLLLGVTFALLDFSEAYPMQLKHTTVMETGGMKGRKKEMTRFEVHEIHTKNLGVETIHSEYGMTELLSQAYSFGNGIYRCPPWMKVFVRSEDDPMSVSTQGKGILNVIDLANLYSCSFIATDDVGIVYPDGSFEVLGRLDSSDIRGCSLLVV